MGTMLGGVFTAPGWGLVGTRVALALTNYRENYYNCGAVAVGAGAGALQFVWLGSPKEIAIAWLLQSYLGLSLLSK